MIAEISVGLLENEFLNETGCRKWNQKGVQAWELKQERIF